MESKSEGPPTLEPWADRSLDGGEVTGGLNDPNLTLPGGRGSTSEDTEEMSETATLVEVSEETAQVVNAAFKTPLANTARQALRRQFGVPKLDTVIKCNLLKEVKDADSQLARIHTLMLDAVAPLVQVLEGLYTIGGLDWWTGLVGWTAELIDFHLKCTKMLHIMLPQVPLWSISMLGNTIFEASCLYC